MAASDHLGRQFEMRVETPKHPTHPEYDHLMASTLTAHLGGEPVGIVEYGPHPDHKQVGIVGMSVHPDFQRRGVASAMMDHVVANTPPDWRVYHGTRTEEAHQWWKRYSRRPGFDPARHTDAYAERGTTWEAVHHGR